MRILFCGGGTAGHVYPNIAIAETFLKNDASTKVAYVTTINGIENKLFEYKKYQIDVIGFKSSLSLSNFRSIKLLLSAIKDCKSIINEFHPDVIVGTGGYATYPVVYAGSKLGIKTVLHESNVVPGKAIKALAKRADRIFVNFEETKKYFKNKDKVITVGNPLRQGYYSLTKNEARKRLNIKEKFVILCFGGSLGAASINKASLELINNLIRYRNDILFIWATGKREYNQIKNEINKKGLSRLENLRVFEYINNMPENIMSADIVICRSGAMTVSEVSLSGKSTIFIPSPNVTNNHQYKNAKMLFDDGAALLLTENELYKLTDTVKELLENDEQRKNMENKIRNYAVLNSNKIIYKEILKIL